MTAKYKSTEMRPIWYRRRRWSLRTMIVFTVIKATATGFWLGVTLFQYLRGSSALSSVTPLVIAFSSAASTLRCTLEVLRDCPRPTKTASGEATLHNASA